MAGGGAFHGDYHATQQAFLEAHELGFRYFGGVFRWLRYDNLKSAVKKILRGHQREETERLIAFRSHWGFQTEFCNPARGNERAAWKAKPATSGEPSGSGSTGGEIGGVERTFRCYCQATNNGGSQAKRCPSGKRCRSNASICCR